MVGSSVLIEVRKQDKMKDEPLHGIYNKKPFPQLILVPRLFHSSLMAAHLHGVVQEWDNDEGLRQRLREQGKHFLPAPYKEIPEAKVECGEHNFAVLKPLVKRLQNPDGTVGMHTIPDLQYQTFSSNKNNVFSMLFPSSILKTQP